MKWAGLVGLALVLTGVLVALDLSHRRADSGDRGPAGIEFVVPADYTVIELGESSSAVAARPLLDALETTGTVAAVFTRSGEDVQLLVDLEDGRIDERVTGRSGTLKRTIWRGSVRHRLEWAEEHGDFEVPGMDPPERRNAYH